MNISLKANNFLMPELEKRVGACLHDNSVKIVQSPNLLLGHLRYTHFYDFHFLTVLLFSMWTNEDYGLLTCRPV